MKSNKKTVIFIAALLLMSIVTVDAQNIPGSGIYLNTHDYETGKLSYVFQCNSQDKIKLNDFLSSSFINITIGGKTTQLSKDSIFGYRNCKNETYRFYKKHDEEFQIIENKGVIVYLSSTKIVSNNGKTSRVVPAYFFSKTADSEILPLTISNLKKAFPDNIKFHDMLDTEFGSGEALSAYSSINNMYKINYLLSQSNR
jgi:hypothetical protein